MAYVYVISVAVFAMWLVGAAWAWNTPAARVAPRFDRITVSIFWFWVYDLLDETP